MTRRPLLAAGTAILALAAAAPAEAFQSCTHDAATETVTATFSSNSTFASGLLSQAGTQIRADGVQCGAATTANTDAIHVVGADGVEEVLNIDLAGGTFLETGDDDEAGDSDEIEIVVHFGTDQPPAVTSQSEADVVVFGSSGADRVTIGLFGTFPNQTSAINLNAGETQGVDADVTFDDDVVIHVSGQGGGDVLRGRGGDGIPAGGFGLYTFFGGPGDDDLTSTSLAVPGPGNDTVRFPVEGLGTVSYFTAGPVTVTLQDGTGDNWGGTAAGADGEGGTDTYKGVPGRVSGSNDPVVGDVFNGSDHDDGFFGNGGPDVANGGEGGDALLGGAGGDTLHGDGGDESQAHLGRVEGGPGNDRVFGDGGDDIVDGGLGDDEVSGGAGDDLLRESGSNQTTSLLQNPNGADDLSGGPDRDSLEYGDPGSPFTPALGRTAGVSVDLDDVADDGATGEGDNARSDVEDVVGGAGNDTLTGDGDANVLSGYDGGDVLRGGGGADTLLGLGARGAFADVVEDELEDEGDTIHADAGADVVFANEGDDVIAARDGSADAINCGPGTDSGEGESLDTINPDCEGIALPVQMPADPPVTPPAVPPVIPPVVTPPVNVPPPVVVPPAPKVAALLTLPSSRRCASRRKFTVRVRREIRGTVERVQIFVNGRRVKSVTGSRIGLPIDLRGLPKGTIRVRLRVELSDGRVAVDTRRYRTCATKRRKGQFGRRRRG